VANDHGRRSRAAHSAESDRGGVGGVAEGSSRSWVHDYIIKWKRDKEDV
jgi:hypothetical protein